MLYGPSRSCISIVTHKPHFKFAITLLKSIRRNLLEGENLEIAVYVDDIDSKHQLLALLSENSLTSILVFCVQEAFETLPKELTGARNVNDYRDKKSIIDSWGAGGHRDWVARKRALALLHLRTLGYSSSWALDSESLVLDAVSFEDLQLHNLRPAKILVSLSSTHEKVAPLPSFLAKTFETSLQQSDLVTLKTAGLRQNDFWLIDLDLFQDSIEHYNQYFKLGIASWLNGSEQTIYESKLLELGLKGDPRVKVEDLDSFFGDGEYAALVRDLQSNRLLISLVKNRSLPVDDIVGVLNNRYFTETKSFRGDYLRQVGLLGPRGRKIRKSLNISIAVSNYQNPSLVEYASSIKTYFQTSKGKVS